MSGCDNIHEMAQAYLDGELGRADVARFEAHVAACQACRAALARYEGLFEALDAARVPAPAAGLAGRVMRRVALARRRRRAWQSAVAAAAILTVACVGLLLVWDDLPAAVWGHVADPGLPSIWHTVCETVAQLGEAAAAEGGEWLGVLPGGGALLAVVLLLVGADVVLALRWRALARLNGS